AAAPPSDAPTNKPSAGTATNAPAAELPIPQSVFALPSSTNAGRDPFFPRSTRLVVVASTTRTNTPPAVADLALSGISGSPSSPLAIISGHTFSVGEEKDVPTASGARV